MVLPETIAHVDGWWANHLGLSPGEYARPGLRVMAHGGERAGYDGAFALRREDTCIVSVPAERVVRARAQLEGVAPAQAFEVERLRAVLGDAVRRVVGPAWLGYRDASEGAVTAPPYARRLTEEDAQPLERLRLACDPEEWEDGGVDAAHEVIYGAFADGELRAAASWVAWDQRIRHVCFIAHPGHRRRGYGAAAAAALTAEGLGRGLIVQWRARWANVASLRTAARLGFAHRLDTIALRFWE